MPFETPRIIVSSAAFFEAETTLHVLNELQIPVTFIEVGIGPTKAAQIATAMRSVVGGRPVLFVGSCGTSLQRRIPFLVQPKVVFWKPSDVRQGNAYLVPGAESVFRLDRLHFKQEIPCVEVSCAGSISLHNESSSYDVYENLELYSAASAWSGIAKSFSCVLGVTNQIGPQAHEQWKANFSAVRDLTASLLQNEDLKVVFDLN